MASTTFDEAKWEETTVCVTGAGGYIASHLVQQLLQKGEEEETEAPDLNLTTYHSPTYHSPTPTLPTLLLLLLFWQATGFGARCVTPPSAPTSPDCLGPPTDSSW